MSYATGVSDVGSGGIAWGIDTIGGTSFARMKCGWGAENSFVDVSASNPLPVGDAGGTLTVDAPVGTPVFVRLSDGTAAITTLPVSAASLPLPGGAATSAKQDSLITLLAGGLPAALAANGGLKIEGVASGVAVPVSAASLPLPSGAATSAKQDTAQTALDAIKTAVELLDNTVGGTELQVDIVGALPAGTNAIGKLAANSGVDIGDVDVTSVPADPFGANADAASATGSISAKLRFIASTGIPITGTVAVSAASLPLPSGAATAANQSTIITLLAGGLPAALGAQGALKVEGVASGTAIPISVASIPSHAVTNAGTFAVQVDGAALTALQLIDNLVLAEDSAHQGTDPGVQALAVRKATPANLSGTDGDYEPLQVDGGLLWTASGVKASGGWTPYKLNSAASTNATSLKGGAGQLGYVTVINTNAAVRYLKFYNKASAPTVGTDTPVQVFPIPGNTAGAGLTINFGAGAEFTTGIAFALTTGAADSDTGAVAANEIVVSCGYK